jgi:hypothetical protein
MFVGVNGNAGKLFSFAGMDAKGFSAWLLAILILRALYNSETLRPAVKPFVALALLTFVLRNYGLLVKQVNEITGLNLPEGK